MAATAFTLYNKAKFNIGNGTIVLGTSPCKLKLCTSAASTTANALTVSLLTSITPEISARGGYVAGGRALATLAWAVGASAKSYKFDADDVIFTASGSSLINVKYAIIGASTAAGVRALCFSKLSTAQFTVTSPNTLTIQFNALGIFEMH